MHKQIAQQRRADLACESAAPFPVHVLRADVDVLSIAKRLHPFRDRGKRRHNDNFDVSHIANLEQQRFDKARRLRLHHVHLPIGGDDFLTHYFLSVNAARPGNSFPSSSSREAPPPVEMKVILSARPACFTAVTESPPPMTVVAPDFASASAIAIVPSAKSGISKMPTGPFHKIVFAFAISSSNNEIVAFPISTACQPSLIPCSLESRLVFRVCAPGLISWASTTSIGRRNLTPRSLARSTSSVARFVLSASTRLAPIGIPSALKNVLAIAPPIRIASAFFINALSTPILSETFAPPMMTTNGLAGLSSSSWRYLSSFSIKKPIARFSMNMVTPTVEAWARCAAPKASLTKTSPNSASALANFGSFASSPC